MMKLIDEKKLSSSAKCIVNDKKLLHKALREDDKSFQVLVVPQVIVEYVWMKCMMH